MGTAEYLSELVRAGWQIHIRWNGTQFALTAQLQEHTFHYAGADLSRLAAQVWAGEPPVYIDTREDC